MYFCSCFTVQSGYAFYTQITKSATSQPRRPLFYTTKHGQKCQNGWSVKANFIHFIRVFTSKVQSGLRPNPLKTRKNTYETCIRHLTNRLELWALYVFYRIDRAWGHYALPGANRNFLGRDTGFPYFRRDCGDHEKQKQKWTKLLILRHDTLTEHHSKKRNEISVCCDPYLKQFPDLQKADFEAYFTSWCEENIERKRIFLHIWWKVWTVFETPLGLVGFGSGGTGRSSAI